MKYPESPNGAWRALEERLYTPHNQKLLRAARDLATDVATGGLVFYGTFVLGHGLLKLGRVSAATAVIPTAFGFVSVVSGSVLAAKWAGLPRRFLYASTDESEKLRTAQDLVDALKCTPESWEILSFGIFGVSIFSMMRGRFFAIAPSDYRFLGAFHKTKASLPATLQYADQGERGAINALGRLIGCHTCGTMKGQYHADHMPPVSFVQKANAKWWRKLLGSQMTQRFYPQCSSCSNVQGLVVKKNIQKLRTHLFAFRAYHFTGAWLVALLSGSFAAGVGSTDTEGDSSKSQIAVRNQHQRTAIENTVSLGISAVTEALREPEQRLDALRKRETTLRQSLRRSPRKDAVQVQQQLSEIEKEKKLVKKLIRSSP